MARFFLLLLGVLALAAGAAGAYLGAAEHEKIVDRHASERLAVSARLLPMALAADAELEVVREVALRTPFQFTLTDFALQGEAPDAALLERAERAVGRRTEAKPVVLVATLGGARAVRDGEAVEPGEAALGLLREALEGEEALGLVEVDGKLHRLRAVPVGTGVLAVAFPVNDAFARKVGAMLGADVTFLHRGKAVASTLGTIERAELAVAAMDGGELFGAGSRPSAYRVFEIVDLPLFAPWKGTLRASAHSSGDATVVHSVSVQPVLDPLVELEKRSLLFAALVGVLGLFFALVGRGGKGWKRQLASLADVAERAAEGDAKAQAPEHLAGDWGRLARAINRLGKGRRAEAWATAPAAAAVAAVPQAPAEAEPGDDADPEALAAAFTFPHEPAPGPTPPPLPTAQPEPAGDATGKGLSFLSEPEPSGQRPLEGDEPAAFSAEPSSPLAFADEPAGPVAFGEEPPGFSTFASSEPAADAPVAPPEGFESSPLAAFTGSDEPASGGFSLAPPEGEDEAAAPSTEPWDMPTRPLPYLSAPPEPAEPEPAPFAAPEPPPPPAPPPLPEEPAFAFGAAPTREDSDEAHFREVYEKFLEVREQCGESSSGISYDRFSAKLRANRAQLMEKYRCLDVRFTVYVKDGRAALKASPIGMNQAG